MGSLTKVVHRRGLIQLEDKAEKLGRGTDNEVTYLVKIAGVCSKVTVIKLMICVVEIVIK